MDFALKPTDYLLPDSDWEEYLLELSFLTSPKRRTFARKITSKSLHKLEQGGWHEQ